MTDTCNPINIVSGPLEPLPPSATYSSLTAPGQFASNGINSQANQSSDVQAIAQTSMNAFTVVKVVAGGVAPVDPTVPGDQTKIFGITISSVIAGQPVQVRIFGVIGNNLTGMSAWNWTVGAPIYVGTLGVLSATPNTTGWNAIVGSAVAANAVDLALPQFYPADALPTVVQYASAAQNVALDASTTKAANIALNATDATLTINNGTDGQVLELAIAQGGTNTLTIAGLLGSYAATQVAGKIDLLTLRYLAARSAWVLVSSTLGL